MPLSAIAAHFRELFFQRGLITFLLRPSTVAERWSLSSTTAERAFLTDLWIGLSIAEKAMSRLTAMKENFGFLKYALENKFLTCMEEINRLPEITDTMERRALLLEYKNVFCTEE